MNKMICSTFLLSLMLVHLGITARLPHSRKEADNEVTDYANADEHKTAQQKSLSMDDTLMFLKQVKQRFADKPGKFHEFMGIFKSYKNNSLSIDEVNRQVTRLLRNELDLLRAFKAYLPVNYATNSRNNQQHLEDAIKFVKAVKERFADKSDVYEQFKHLLDEYKRKNLNIAEVFVRVSHLFKNDEFLRSAFVSFIPPVDNSEKELNEKDVEIEAQSKTERSEQIKFEKRKNE